MTSENLSFFDASKTPHKNNNSIHENQISSDKTTPGKYSNWSVPVDEGYNPKKTIEPAPIIPAANQVIKLKYEHKSKW